MVLESLIFDRFRFNLLSGVFNSFAGGSGASGNHAYDTIKAMLVNPITTGALATNTVSVLADVTSLTGFVETTNESGTGYTSGGKALTGITVTQNTGSAYLNADDVAWTLSTFTAAGALLYSANTTIADTAKTSVSGSSTLAAQVSPVICYFEFPEAIRVANGTFTLQWNNSPAAIISLM